jgi:MarR family transcriptional regulator, organic hydroperoxide resistance regulator
MGSEVAAVADVKPKEIAGAILGFEEQFNEKLAPIFKPARGDRPPLTKSQAKAMYVLFGRQGQTATELGEAMSMTKASLTGILDALEAEGIARREADPGDRRRVLASLTAAGRRHCERRIREADAMIETRFAPLSQAERSDFVRYVVGATEILKRLEV